MTIEDLIRSLQASIAPCVLISGLGLLMLSMTNRLARPIDRIRQLRHEVKGATENEKESLRQQFKILYKRCHLLRVAIALVAASIFFVSMIMLMLFFILAFNMPLISFIKWFFTLSLLCLIVSLTFLLRDISLTLRSIKIEVAQEFL